MGGRGPLVLRGGWMACSGWWLGFGASWPAGGSVLSGTGFGSRAAKDGFESGGCACLLDGGFDSLRCEEGPKT